MKCQKCGKELNHKSIELGCAEVMYCETCGDVFACEDQVIQFVESLSHDELITILEIIVQADKLAMINLLTLVMDTGIIDVTKKIRDFMENN